MWYYAKNLDHVGPLSTNELAALIKSGTINSATLVWNEEMPNWARLSDVPLLLELIPKKPPPLPGSSSAPPVIATSISGGIPRLQELPLAGPWLRFLARCLDVWLVTTMLTISLGLVLAFYLPSALLALNSANDKVLGLIFLPIVMILLALCTATFGNTIGKALLGITVRKLTQQGSLGFFLKREMRVWTEGLAIGIPFIALFTQGSQYRKVVAGQPASYDLGRGRVEARPVSAFRKSLGVLILVGLVGGFIAFVAHTEELDRQELASFTWRNPITKRTTLLSGTWHPKDIEAKGGDLYHFAADSLLAEALFGHEKLGASDIDPQAYATAIQQTISENFTVTTEWQPVTVGGRPALRANGSSKTDANIDFQVTITIDGEDAWRTLIFTRGRKVDDATFGREFSEAAFSTI
ncbi:RDD family protein [Mesorhizobium sp. M0028]|uniref:RDD family protein n=1 Tax=Mesorhizobium sp. M0028 TaxID=2956849 RepID=UPI0033365442